MAEFNQVCKQCGLLLPVDEFKKYASRSEGIRQTTTGRYTICKHCEKMSAYAAKLQKLYESGEATEDELKERAALIDYYQSLVDRGLPLVTKPVRKLMGVPEESKKRSGTSKVLAAIAEAQRRMEAAANDDVLPAEMIRNAQVSERIAGIQSTTALRQTMGHTLGDEPIEPEKGYSMVDADKIMKAIGILNDLLEMEFVREPMYYENMCDEALLALRCSNKDGKVPYAYNELASKVLERLDEYTDNYDG